jgi:hypothetical protein
MSNMLTLILKDSQRQHNIRMQKPMKKRKSVKVPRPTTMLIFSQMNVETTKPQTFLKDFQRLCRKYGKYEYHCKFA